MIGTLLGTRVGDTVEISAAFPVPHNETDEMVWLDIEWHSSVCLRGQ